jgi:predicted small metal-binding protein
MTLQCRDTGGSCNWEGQADREEELIKAALQHLKDAHYLEWTPKVEETARKSVRDD